jgi:SSS family solute:Na+ symporter
MYIYLYVILAYLLVLMGLNIYRSKKVKGHEDFMVAGRTLSLRVMVFTLICTWIGSGTFIAGAEYAFRAGWSSMWMPAGAWVGIVVIYFLAAKIRTFGQYTIGDILEVRYGKFARLFGAIALIIAFTTIVSYQFRAGGYILNVTTDGAISVALGQTIAAAFVILFTALAGMIAVAYTDLPNGIIIVLACLVSVPFVVLATGGWGTAAQVLPPGHMAVFSPDFGEYPALKALGYCLATMLLLMGVQSMYQKFYSAKSPKEARQAVALWIIGTIFVEVVVIVIAVYGATYFWHYQPPVDPASVVLMAARYMVPWWVGLLLLSAACVVVISTGMNYLLSPTTNIIRDIYQRFVKPDADSKRMVALQKVFIVIIGFCAWLMIFIPTAFGLNISVLRYSYFAYTMYGVSITPALIAALAWKRATRLAGIVSIVSGATVTLLLELVVPQLIPHVMKGGDLWGIPSIYPAVLVSFGTLVIVSYLTPPPKPEELRQLFPEAT